MLRKCIGYLFRKYVQPEKKETYCDGRGFSGMGERCSVIFKRTSGALKDVGGSLMSDNLRWARSSIGCCCSSSSSKIRTCENLKTMIKPIYTTRINSIIVSGSTNKFSGNHILELLNIVQIPLNTYL